MVVACYGRMGHEGLFSCKFCESGGCAKFCCLVVFLLCLFVRRMLGNSIGSPSICAWGHEWLLCVTQVGGSLSVYLVSVMGGKQ